LEGKLEQGVDRSLSAIAGYVKVTLQAEQKKNSFKPEGDDAAHVNIATATPVRSLRSLFIFSPL